MNATQAQIATPTTQRKAKHTILFLAASPLGMDQLALDEEARAIRMELERSRHRDRFELVTRSAAQPMDLIRELRKLKPTVVHLSGHGGRGDLSEAQSNAYGSRDVVVDSPIDAEAQHSLFLQGPGGCPWPISAAGPQRAFDAAGSSVRLVILSACYTEVHAEALLGTIDCVVGINGGIIDKVARDFAIGFYGGLGECESVAAAFKQGIAAIHLENQCESNFKLFTRTGSEPESIYIVERPQPRQCLLVIKAKLSDFDAEVIARVRDELRRLTGDVSLEIIDVQEGSVRVRLSLSGEAARRLETLRDGGQLAEICGFEVSSIRIDPKNQREQLLKLVGPVAGAPEFDHEKGVAEPNHRRSGVKAPDAGATGRADNVRLVVVTGDPALRFTFARSLARCHTVSFATAREALERVLGVDPMAAVVIDGGLPDMSSFELLERIRPGRPNVPMILLADHLDRECVNRAARLGAWYLCKPVSTSELQEVIDHALYVKAHKPRIDVSVLIAKHGLSRRESEVLALALEGLRRDVIRKRLGIRETTVKKTIARLLRKCGVMSLRRDREQTPRLGDRRDEPGEAHVSCSKRI